MWECWRGREMQDLLCGGASRQIAAHMSSCDVLFTNFVLGVGWRCIDSFVD